MPTADSSPHAVNAAAASAPPAPSFAPPPEPGSDRPVWVIACALAACGLVVLLGAVLGLFGGGGAVSPPAVPFVAATPAASAASAAAARGAARSSAGGTAAAAARTPASALAPFTGDALSEPVSASWLEGFYPIYATAQSTFAVNWLLIASIHRQETAFSTARGTYHGLNFAGCCGGPMQFNVRNGRITTWDLVRDSYRYGRRPARYGHMTATHPSIYDDFDAIMAGAHLLSADGAGRALDAAAWGAAYSYYGHDAAGVAYADEVIARAIGWSQHGFCASCATDPRLVEAVHAAYGAPVLAALEAPRTPQPRARPARRAKRRLPR